MSAAQYATQLDQIAERVEAMPCTRALHDVDHDEFYDGPCHHCDLLNILDREPPCPRMTPEANADHALAALALLDAIEHGNPINQKAILDSLDPVDLITGLVQLASGFRAGMAAGCCMSVEDLNENTRTMYLAVTG